MEDNVSLLDFLLFVSIIGIIIWFFVHLNRKKKLKKIQAVLLTKTNTDHEKMVLIEQIVGKNKIDKWRKLILKYEKPDSVSEAEIDNKILCALSVGELF